jgi:hypothetical protein
MSYPAPGTRKASYAILNKAVKTAEIGSGRNQQNVPYQWVQFRIDDVYVPEPAQILMQLHGKDILQGKIIDVSDGGTQNEAFDVVEVEGLSQPVVVATKNVKEIRCE